MNQQVGEHIRRFLGQSGDPREIADAFRAFDADHLLRVAVLTGAGGTFCAGADLKAVATGNGNPTFQTGLIGRRTALRTAKTIRAGNHRDSKSQSLAQAH